MIAAALSYYWRVTRQDNVVAQALLEKATAIDPNYGQALGVLAASHTFCAHMGWADMATVAPIAERAAMSAILADSEDPWAHCSLGCVYLYARRFDDSLAEFELALRLNPNFSLAQGYYGLALSYCGRWEEGDLAARRALRLSPRDPFSAIYCGIASYAQSFVGRNYDEAMQACARGASDNAATSSAPIACSLPPLAWRAGLRSPRPHFRSFAACSLIFRSRGSQMKCQSSRMTNGSIIWKPFCRTGLT